MPQQAKFPWKIQNQKPSKRWFIKTALGEWFVLGELKPSPDLWRQFPTSPSPFQRAASTHPPPDTEEESGGWPLPSHQG